MKKKIEKIINDYFYEEIDATQGASKEILLLLNQEILKVLPKEVKPSYDKYTYGESESYNEAISDCRSAISKLLK